MAGYPLTPVPRLASNQIRPWLLAPEMFGLMAAGHVIFIGLRMLSALGLGGGPIQSRRRDEPVCLNAVWVVPLARGLTVALCGLAFAAAYMLATTAGWPPPNSVYVNPRVPKLVAVKEPRRLEWKRRLR